MTRASGIGDALAEFDGDSSGDAMLDDRLRRIVNLTAADPSDSFPDQMESVADREALYRFLANPKVTLPGVLSGHIRQTQDRIRRRGVVRMVHDTSTFPFLGDREGLGVLGGGSCCCVTWVAPRNRRRSLRSSTRSMRSSCADC